MTKQTSPRPKVTIPKEFQSIECFDICLFTQPITVGDMTFTGAKRLREAKVRDRINAVRWCTEVLGFESADGILAGLASSTMAFGSVSGSTELDKNGVLQGPLTLTDGQPLAADSIIDAFSYDDFRLLALLMGKSAPSPESKTETLENSSNTPLTDASVS